MENLKKVLAVVIELGNVLDKVLKAQGVSAKLACLLGMTDELFALSGVNFVEVKNEFLALDDAKKKELVVFFAQKFDLENDVMEQRIEQGLSLAVEAECLIEEIVAFSKSFKK